MGMSIISAVSGVGRGIKYLSNLNLVLSLILLADLRDLRLVPVRHDHLRDGAGRLHHQLRLAVVRRLRAALPPTPSRRPAGGGQGSFRADIASIYGGGTNRLGLAERLQGRPAGLGYGPGECRRGRRRALRRPEQGRLFGWQAGWTTFYWAWWIAFSPFVGLFLARISKGPHDPRVHPRLRHRTGAGLLCLDDHPGRHGDRSGALRRRRRGDHRGLDHGQAVRHTGLR